MPPAPHSDRAAERELARACRRHGVPLDVGGRLLPLVRRALAAAPALQRALLDVVDATLARDAAERRRTDHDQRALVAVAGVLHRLVARD